MSTKDQILLSLNQIFTQVFQEYTELSMHTRAEEVYQWTSLNHIQLIAAIERQFGIKLSFSEIRDLRSVEDIVQAIIRHTVC